MNGLGRGWIGVVLAAAVGAGVARGDLIELKDGTTVSGTMVRKDNVMVITRDTPGGGTVSVAPDDVVRVTLTGVLTPAQKAEGDWTRAHYELKKAEKFADYMAILEKFAASHANTPAGDQARNLVATYREIAGQDPVKFRGRWLPRAQVEVITREAEEKARPAVANYKAGKLKEAQDAARDALKVDDGNATALAVIGLVDYRLNRLQEARTDFLKLVDAAPNSVLGWNNLGVVAFGLKRDLEGLAFYTKAVQVAPENRLVMDNVVEAMRAYTGNRLAPAYKDLERQFLQAETAMEAQAAKRGVFRYGSTWVTQEQRDRLIAAKASLDKSKASLEAQYDQAVRAAEGIAAQIKQAQADYDSAVNDANYWGSQSVVYSPSGGTYVDGWAQSRRDLAVADADRTKRRIQALELQRAQLGAAVKQMFAEAQRIKTELAKAEAEGITGVQRLMDLGDEVPPPTAVKLPAKDVGGVVVVNVPKVDVPEREVRRGTYVDQNVYFPVYPLPGVVTPPAVVVPPGSKGPFVVPNGGILVIPPAPKPDSKTDVKPDVRVESGRM